VKIGDLVMKQRNSSSREDAGLGLVIEVAYKAGPFPTRSGYKVRWSNDYGTFWASEEKLERVNANR
jgi:hypothetical protein